MLELSILSAADRRISLPWTKAPQQAIEEQLTKLLDAGVRFVSVGHLLAVQRGVADSREGLELALAAEGDIRSVMEILPIALERQLPCMYLAEITDRQGRATLAPRQAELRALSDAGVAVEFAGRSDWELGRVAPEQVFGSMLRARRELERVLGRTPSLYCMAERRPDPRFPDLVMRAGFEICAGPDGSGVSLPWRALREHAQLKQRAGVR